MVIKVFTVNGMKCNNCKAHVEEALKAVQGVHNVEASIENANVSIEYDENQTTPSDLKQAVDNCGRYELTL